MRTADVRTGDEAGGASADRVDMALEVVVIPVSDVSRAAAFYERLGWRKDVDVVTGHNRLLQFTPPGSSCSIIFGTHLTSSAPGTAQSLYLVVSDIEAAHDALIRQGDLTVDEDEQLEVGVAVLFPFLARSRDLTTNPPGRRPR